MDKTKIKVGGLNIPSDCKPSGNSLRVDDPGRILTLRVAYYPLDFVAWDSKNDVYTDQYMGQDDVQIRDIEHAVDLEETVQDAVFQLAKSYAPASAKIVFQSGARGTFSIEEETLYLHYHPVPQLEIVSHPVPYCEHRSEKMCRLEPDLKEILNPNFDLLARQNYQWHIEHSGCYADKQGVDGLCFAMFILERAQELILTSTAHLSYAWNTQRGREYSGQLSGQTILHVEDPLGRQIIQFLKER